MKSNSRSVIALIFASLFCLSTIARADSGGWVPAGLSDENVGSLVLDPASPGTMYAATTTGIYKTVDGGAQWRTAGRGLPAPELGSVSIYLSSAGLFATTPAGLYKSTDGGDSWKAVRGLAKNHGYFSFAAFGSTVLVSEAACQLVRFDCAWEHGTLWRSIDGGVTWNPGGISEDIVRAVAIDPLSPSTVFAGVFGPNRRGLFKSSDGGRSFTDISDGLPGSYVFEIGVSPIPPSTVYVSRETGVFRSPDGGESWTSANVGLPLGGVGLAMDPTSASTLYAATDNAGVFRTTDGGDHWLPIGTGSPLSRVTSIARDPASPSRIYAGTFGHGVYKLEVLDVAPCAPGPKTLCLNSGRFRVEVGWLISRPLDAGGAGQAVPLTADTGAFWFFSPSNLELMVKVLDGRGVNGHFWFFWGALSDVSYTITVTDTRTGEVKTYTNPQGRLESRADILAF